MARRADRSVVNRSKDTRSLHRVLGLVLCCPGGWAGTVPFFLKPGYADGTSSANKDLPPTNFAMQPTIWTEARFVKTILATTTRALFASWLMTPTGNLPSRRRTISRAMTDAFRRNLAIWAVARMEATHHNCTGVVSSRLGPRTHAERKRHGPPGHPLQDSLFAMDWRQERR